MEDLAVRQLVDLYGLNPNIPHLAFQFPRLPPRSPHPAFKIHENPMREKFVQDAELIAKKLQGFQHMYRQHAAALMNMGSPIVPPGHPLFSRQDSVETLKVENDKLLKENLKLKKQLERSKEHN